MVDQTDIDPEETQEWIESLDSVLEREGPQRAHFLLERLIDKTRRSGAYLPFSAKTAYVNTIPLSQQRPIPGLLEELGHGRRRLLVALSIRHHLNTLHHALSARFTGDRSVLVVVQDVFVVQQVEAAGVDLRGRGHVRQHDRDDHYRGVSQQFPEAYASRYVQSHLEYGGGEGS